jgi:hypothetical protein
MASKRRYNKRAKKTPRELLTVRFEFWELETAAFEHLSADATRVYLFMKKRYNGSNNGEVIFSHRDAQEALRSSWRRAANALAELEHCGFIKLRTLGEPGPSTHPNIRPAGEWQLTVFECGGQPASKDFARWDGTVFEPPYRGDLGSATRANRVSKKQLPTCNMTTPRLQHNDASPANGADFDVSDITGACNMTTPPTDERLQHEDTCRYTTIGGSGTCDENSLLNGGGPTRHGRATITEDPRE